MIMKPLLVAMLPLRKWLDCIESGNRDLCATAGLIDGDL